MALLPSPSISDLIDHNDQLSVSYAMYSTGIALVLTFTVLLASVYLLPHWLLRCLKWHSHPSVLWSVCTSSQVCSLTIDDSPTPSTPAILDILAEHKVKATFFIISGLIPGNEEVLRRIVREGHTLANHLTEDRASILDELHIFEQKLLQCDRAIDQFQPAADETAEPLETQQPLLEKDGPENARLETNVNDVKTDGDNRPRSRWTRPASGWFTTPMREILTRHNYRICLGSVYPHDAQIQSETLNSIFLRARTSCGSVIIVHDRSWTIGVLETALPVLTRRFTFVSLDELLLYHETKFDKASK
uniref:NodB homology domain-containing protein n=1 Tax=Hyaloperonospora arabidopsidis (strain Emoy2) TaxID=559515 RepID=M4BBT9_HYAAE